MAELNVSELYRTVQETGIWLKSVETAMGVDNREVAYDAHGVLLTLRDRLDPNETFHMAAQLRILVGGASSSRTTRLPASPKSSATRRISRSGSATG